MCSSMPPGLFVHMFWKQCLSCHTLLNAMSHCRAGPLMRWCAYTPPLQTRHEDAPDAPLWQYPTNILRNRALQLVDTHQVFLVDGDFVPSISMQQVAQAGVFGLKNGEVVIVPAFRIQEDISDTILLDSSRVMEEKARLIACVESGAHGCKCELQCEAIITAMPI